MRWTEKERLALHLYGLTLLVHQLRKGTLVVPNASMADKADAALRALREALSLTAQDMADTATKANRWLDAAGES